MHSVQSYKSLAILFTPYKAHFISDTGGPTDLTILNLPQGFLLTFRNPSPLESVTVIPVLARP